MAIKNKLIPIDGTVPLHKLGASARQLSYMQEHSEAVLELLDVLLERTYAEAPRRKQSYKLRRKVRENPKDRERLLEKAIWTQWNDDEVKQNSQPFAANTCQHVQSYQMPLQGSRSDGSWGKLDLIGVTQSGLPVVLELKREESVEPPLRILIEGLAYAVAVRRAWNEGSLREQWNETVTSQSRSFAAPTTLTSVPVIGIAPTNYWKRCIGTQGVRSRGKVKDSAWKPFCDLCTACGRRGFPIHFLQFSTGDEFEGLPSIEGIERVKLPR